nr:NACHT, LRR and PYD domains-containing protein 12-like [Nerophis lumbriciformis]
MVFSRKRLAYPLRVRDEILPQVKDSKYLGVLFTSEDRREQEIERRIGAASAVMQTLQRLNNCNLDKRSCHLLASVLSSPSNLRHLDVNDNNLLDMGVEILSKGLASQNCVLKVLKLERCGITKQGCLSLAEALKLKPSSLRELHLSCNDLSDLGVEHLSKGLASPHCNLKVLGLRNCKITERGCISLAKALKLNPSHLQKLHLSDNNLSDEGVMILSEGLASSHCKLKYLWLSYCRITKKGCISLAEVLKLNPSHLQELDLSYNDLLDEGFEIFCKGLANPHCILKVLRLSCCSITEKGCISLAEVLKINPSHLRKLDLSANNLSDKGVEILLNGLASPHCTLKVLRLENCRITQEGCISLAEVLKSEPSHLQELNLVGNQVGEAKRVLLDVQEDPNCNLKIVRRILLGQGTVRRLQDGVGATGKAASLTEFEAVCPPASRSFQQLYWEVDLNGKAGNDNNSTALMPRRPASVTSLSQALEKTGRRVCAVHGDLPSFVLFTEIYPEWNVKKSYKRRLFLEELGNALIRPEVLKREPPPSAEGLPLLSDASPRHLQGRMALDSKRRELLWNTLRNLGKNDFESFRFHTDLPESIRENTSREYIADELVKKHGENTLEETIKILKTIGNNNVAELLRTNMLKLQGPVFSDHDDDQIGRLKGHLQDNLKRLYSFAPECNTERWEQQPLADVYTDLDVTYGGDVSPDERHEVLQMETRAAAAKDSILPCDIFKSRDGKSRPIRTLLTVGFAGIGKTFLVQKFVLDWASGNTNLDVDFIFPFTFRELNMDKEESFNLAELIRRYVYESRDMSEDTLNNIFASLQTSGKRDYESSNIKILFVLDGLDECNFKMNLKNKAKVDLDVTKAYPLPVLLAYLIKKNLLPCARLWITTRPAAARDIPSNFIDSKTEVRGFSDSQRLEYFRKRFPSEERITKHIQKSRTIFIMCHMPIFCWLTATVLQDHLKKGKEGELPATLTNMYSAFVAQHLENSKERQTTEHIGYMKALAKLAFHHTMNNCQIFYEKDMVDSSFDYSQAAKHCGLFTEVFKEVHPLKSNKQKMFQFIHLTIQEYLAAVYVMMSLFHDNKNVLAGSKWSLKGFSMPSKQRMIIQVHKSALQKASESEGNLDLFLRFLLGLSLQCNQELVGELLTAPQDCGESKSKTVKLIKKRIKQNTPEKNINLFYCLNELKDDSLLEQIQQELVSKKLSWQKMPNDMWSALAFFLLTSDEAMNCFEMHKYSTSPLGLKKLLSVVKASQKSVLSNCGMTTQGCFPLAEALELNHSNLQELDLSYNDLSDEGMDILFVGLVSQHCILESLKLLVCNITEGGCISLAKALKLNHSHLQELDLSSNSLSDKGVAILSKGLASPHCILKILRLERCGITEQGCVSLAEALELNHSHLQQLDLSQNKFSDEGVESLSDGLASPHCILKVLRLSCCGITKKGCLSLADALELNPSHLQQLDLSQNELSDEGVKILSKGLASPHSILKVLRLENCLITKIGCFSVAKLNPQRLDLSWNNLLDDGVKILLEGLASPRCNLQVLELRNCKITKQGCISLAKVLKLNSFHLQELKLGGNQIGQEGERVLLDLQKDTSFCLKSVSFEW